MLTLHVCTALSTLSLLSFVITGNAPAKVGIWAVGGGCAIAAWIGIERQRKIEREEPLNQQTLEALAEQQYVHEQNIWAIQNQYNAYIANLQQEITNLQQQVQQLEQFKAMEIEEGHLELQTQYEKLEAEKGRLEQERDRLLAEEDLMVASLKEQQQEFEQLKQQCEDDLNARAEQRYKELEEQREAIIQDLETQYQAKEETLAVEIELRDKLIGELQGKLRAAMFNLPSLKDGFPGMVARQIQECLIEHEIVASYEDSHAYPNGVIDVWLSLPEGVKVKQIKERLDDIRMRVGLGELDFSVEDEVVQFTFTTSIDISAPTVKTKDGRKIEITEPAVIDIRKSFDSIHYHISGPTGAGKSTLVDNLINYVALRWKEEGVEEASDIVLVDPKYPDTDWSLNGQELEPQYKGYEEAVEGVQAMAQLVRDRLDEATEAKQRKKPIPYRKPTIFIIDEAEDLIATYGKDASDPILSVLRVGRSTRVVAIIIGQSPMCSDYGMKKANLSNCTRFWLRDAALKGIDDCGVPLEIKREIKEQLYARQSLAREQLLAGQDPPPASFYALIKSPLVPPFVMSMPKPGYFAEQNASTPAFTIPEQEQQSLADLIDQADSQLPGSIVQQLEQIFERSNRPEFNELPEHLRMLVEFARSRNGQWFNPSDVCSNRQWFRKNSTTELVAEWLQALAAQGIGEWDGKKYRYVEQEV